MLEKKPDMVLFALVLIIVLLGVMMVFNVSTSAGKRIHNNTDHFLIRQALFAFAGIILLISFSFYPYEKLITIAKPAVIISLLLLLLVLIPGIGRKVNGARRWMAFGPLQFQPSEFVKLALIIYLCMIFAKKKIEGKTSTFRGFIPPLIITLSFFGLIFLEPDFSTAGILLFTGIAIFYMGGVPIRHLLGLAVSSTPFIMLLVFNRGYMRDRLFAHIDPLSDFAKSGYQIIQSLISFQRGGIFGNGLGSGVQKMGILPESHTDFIMAAHSEEIGLIGICMILTLLAFMVLRIFKVALNAPDDFSRLFAYGIAIMIAWQALINMAVVTGMIPASGLPFPFISAGGSSLLALCIGMGIVLNISKRSAVKGVSK